MLRPHLVTFWPKNAFYLAYAGTRVPKMAKIKLNDNRTTQK